LSCLGSGDGRRARCCLGLSYECRVLVGPALTLEFGTQLPLFMDGVRETAFKLDLSVP
jgi:hypothetical protein